MPDIPIMKLIPRKSKTNQPLKDVILHCRDMLARAESGELRAVVSVGCDSEGALIHGATYPGDALYVLIGGLASVQYLFTKRFVEEP